LGIIKRKIIADGRIFIKVGIAIIKTLQIIEKLKKSDGIIF